MRPTRSNTKKPERTLRRCVVRLEKSKSGRVLQEIKKKTLSGPMRKRPISPKELKKKIQVARSVNNSSPDASLIAGRTRRTPKPNPKYTNESLVTSKGINKQIKVPADSGDESDDDIDEEEDEPSSSEGGEPSEDESSEYDMPIKKLRSSKTITPPQKPNRSLPVKSKLTSVATKDVKKRAFEQSTPTINQSRQVDKALVRSIARTLNETAPKISLLRKNLTEKQSIETKKRKMDMEQEKRIAESTILERNKRLNIELYDANETKPSSEVKSLTATSKSFISRTKPNQSNTSIQKKNATNNTSAKNKKITDFSMDYDDDIQIALLETEPTPRKKKAEDAGKTANTQDDFETMPTFTIVNVKDIMNKKGDVKDKKSTNSVNVVGSPPNATMIASVSAKNRRKTGHTTILSDKIDLTNTSDPLPRTPFPPKKSVTILNNNIAKIATNKKANEKPAPRILNSILCKKTTPVTPMIGKFDDDNKVENDLLTKENLQLNQSTSPVKNAVTQQKRLPTEKVVIQRQGNKLVKKITCFETWYVIKIPETEAIQVKNQLVIPLIKLGNAAGDIQLPTGDWTYKVTLQQMTENGISKGNYEKYTGDVHDLNIKDEDKEKYQPTCVMFRRTSLLKDKARLPYDRAVIFKNKTFFTNIDGKNIKLVGAPFTINNFEEIQILLQLIDELTLNSPYVEPTSTI